MRAAVFGAWSPRCPDVPRALASVERYGFLVLILIMVLFPSFIGVITNPLLVAAIYIFGLEIPASSYLGLGL